MLISRIQGVFCGPCSFSFRSVPGKTNGSTRISYILKYLNPCKENYRLKSTNANQNSLSESKESEQNQITLAEKVKQTTKDASYLGIIVIGISVTGIICYAVFRELFSRTSPNSVYTEALKLCKNNEQVVDSIGSPILGFGEETARGRRRYVSNLLYEKDGVNFMRMKFYVKGSRRRGTVHLEVKENERGKYEYRYLFVELEGYPPKTIILEDNRSLTDMPTT